MTHISPNRGPEEIAAGSRIFRKSGSAISVGERVAMRSPAGNPEGRTTCQLVRSLYSLDYNADEFRVLIRLINWMVQLYEEFNQ